MASRITMRQIEALRAVVLTGGASAAARLLNVSQPSVSRLLADLEREVGFPLFDRSNRRLRPTPECEVIYTEAEHLFAGLSGIAARANEIRQAGLGHLRIACMPSLSSGVLPKIIAQLCQRRPEVQISLSSYGSATVVEWVSRGLVDIGIALKPLEAPNVESQLLITTELVCAMPEHHPLAQKAVIEPKDLAEVDFIGLTDDRLSWGAIANVLHAAEITPRRRISTQRAHTAYALVAEGAGVTVVEPFTAHAFKGRGVVTRPFQPRIPLSYFLFFPAGRPPSGVARELQAELQTFLTRIAPCG
ncbi:MAG: LysR family transcriptional regulator [Rhodospirillaceae bacterium]|nr:LysR family transcriptional regulator [Rhodospirillaceae bacterium]